MKIWIDLTLIIHTLTAFNPPTPLFNPRSPIYCDIQASLEPSRLNKILSLNHNFLFVYFDRTDDVKLNNKFNKSGNKLLRYCIVYVGYFKVKSISFIIF